MAPRKVEWKNAHPQRIQVEDFEQFIVPATVPVPLVSCLVVRLSAAVQYNSLKACDAYSRQTESQEVFSRLESLLSSSDEVFITELCNGNNSRPNNEFMTRLWQLLELKSLDSSKLKEDFVSGHPVSAGAAILCSLIGRPLAQLIFVEVGSVVELLELPTSTLGCVRDSSFAVQPCLRSLQKAMSWLLADSKVGTRDQTVEGVQTGSVWTVLMDCMHLVDLIDEQKDGIKAEVRGKWPKNAESVQTCVVDSICANWGLRCLHLSESSASLIEELLLPKLDAMLSQLSKIDSVGLEYLSSDDDSYDQWVTAKSLFEKMKSATTVPLYEECRNVRHNCSKIREQAMNEEAVTLYLVEGLQNMALATQTLVNAVTLLTNFKKIMIFKNNANKIVQRKKKIQWKIPCGQGVEEYLSAVRSPIVSNVEAHGLLIGALKSKLLIQNVLEPKNQVARKPKTPKGTQDFEPKKMLVRECLLERIGEIFRSYGATPIDTPVFELKEVLTNKYGEDQKLIFDLKDQGGEQLALRYDLTVPFARYCASHSVDKMKRYQIGKVYRRDEPQINRGRCREFYSCDVDIAGPSDNMVADAEVLSILCHSLSELTELIGKFKVKLSHRVLLDGIMMFCGVPDNKVREISSAIDKLDKETWETVKNEMTDLKGLDEIVADRIGQFVRIKGSIDSVTSQVMAIENATSNEQIKSGLSDLKIILDLLDAAQYAPLVEIDLSLARGLDYYTGPVFEAVMIDQDETAVGSIAGGGRYDNLIGMFANKPIPACGFSLGIERIFKLAETHLANRLAPPQASGVTDVFVCSIGDNMLKERMRVGNILRRAGIACEYSLAAKVKLIKQLAMASEQNVPLVVLFGESELENGTVKLRELSFDSSEAENRNEMTVSLTTLVSEIKTKLLERKPCRAVLESLLFSS